ncbi:uncharacterized protein EV154DRAFT_484006 [Mucor mucedo]|uniref:uncharacterized protein n=1 Tax=Mucor mucedo TaxID=29922 RepID=UPI00221F77DC|nr:uncharacterized protein EV154DRAFT_484006 [Mucor mucedo]KAI7888535.1 hypothetical protein EV154DRAFT_484006 [Mucor mucedo]
MYETTKAVVLKRKTKRHLEIETLRTQRTATTATNKRLRAEIENDATSSQSSQQSQSSYEPNKDEIGDLEPTWNIRDCEICAVLAAFRKHSFGLQHKFRPVFILGKMAIKQSSSYLTVTMTAAAHRFRLFNRSFPPRSDSSEAHGAIIILEFAARFFTVCKLQTYTKRVNLKAVDESMYINLSINPLIDVIFDYNSELLNIGIDFPMVFGILVYGLAWREKRHFHVA